MKQSIESKIAEYQAAHDSYLHYDGFRWQAGSLLIAGVFVYWGLIASSTPSSEVIALSGLLINILMSIWILFAHHYRQIYLCKLHRIQELERELGMKQHLRFIRTGDLNMYNIFGPRGHHLDIAMYIITSLGGPLLGIISFGFTFWLILPLPLTAIVLLSVLASEKQITQSLSKVQNSE